ncbi:MAG: UvrD-helicase domain-containing protein, partial [Bacilli bacterium]
MAGVKFTPSQQEAIAKKGTNIIVSAGAGSGKTAVLSERVLHFVKDEGYKLDEFLILTFTNLAAKEMKDRIRKKLEDNNLEESKNVDTSDITTFDSYAFSLVKKYHFLLGLSSDVSIVDSNVIAVKKREIVDRIFTDYYEQNDSTFNEMIKKFCFKSDDDLQKLVIKLFDEASLHYDEKEYLNNYIATFFSSNKSEELLSLIFSRMKEHLSRMSEYCEYFTQEPCSKKDPTPYQRKVKEILLGLENAQKIDEFVSYLSSMKIPSYPSKIEEGKEEKKLFDDEKKKLKDFIDKNGLTSEQSIKDAINENKEYVQLLISICLRLNEEQYSYKEQKQVFEFNDIQKMAFNLVKNNLEVRDSIKNKLKMIMIDEYQDTSSLQEDFISLISNHNVYMVGDIKQSIYRFRNACSDIFQNKYDKYKRGEDGLAIDLNSNFRSRQEVLEDINIIFKEIMSPAIGGADYKKDHIIEYGNKAYLDAGDNGDSNHSHFITYDDEIKGDNAAIHEATLIARDIINKYNNGYLVFKPGYKKVVNGEEIEVPPTTRRCKLSDFCILMDRGSSFDIYKRVFGEYRIPLSVEADENIASNNIVLMLTSLLKMIKCIKNADYQSEEFIHSFLSLARSFVYHLSDEEIYLTCKNKEYYSHPLVSDLRDIIFHNETLPLNELFSLIIFKNDIYHKLILIGDVKKNELYLDMFLSYFEQMANLDYSLDEFISYLENLNDNDLKIVLPSQGSDVDSVRMMNIHKSKGLEFPIVYFSGLQKKFNESYKKESLGVSKEFGLFLPLTSKKTSPIKVGNNIYESREDLSEKIRLFYVALTRAREKMIFVLPEYKEAVRIEESKSFYHFLSNFYDLPLFEREYVESVEE